MADISLLQVYHVYIFKYQDIAVGFGDVIFDWLVIKNFFMS